MSAYAMEMEEIRKLKRTIYKPPLPLKKQRVTMRAQMPGKVKILSKEEVFLYKIKKYRQILQEGGL